MIAPCQSGQDLALRARDIPPLHALGSGRELAFRHVGAAGQPHLRDDAYASLAEELLPDLGGDHAARRVGRRQRDPEGDSEEKKEDREERTGGRRAAQE